MRTLPGGRSSMLPKSSGILPCQSPTSGGIVVTVQHNLPSPSSPINAILVGVCIAPESVPVILRTRPKMTTNAGIFLSPPLPQSQMRGSLDFPDSLLSKWFVSLSEDKLKVFKELTHPWLQYRWSLDKTVPLNGWKFASSNQKNHPDLGSNMSSAGNFFTPFFHVETFARSWPRQFFTYLEPVVDMWSGPWVKRVTALVQRCSVVDVALVKSAVVLQQVCPGLCCATVCDCADCAWFHFTLFPGPSLSRSLRFGCGLLACLVLLLGHCLSLPSL